MHVFHPVQFQHALTSHVKGPHDFPDTQDKPRPWGPNVTEVDYPKEYASGAIAESNQHMKEVFHGESWDTPESDEFEMPYHARYGETVRRMVPR